MASKENNIVANILLKASKLKNRLFRNNVGFATYPNGAVVKYGVCNPGGSDALGWTSYIIKLEDVGGRVAVFTAAECKTLKGKASAPQINFMDAVVGAGGIAGICRSDGDYEALVTAYRPLK